MAKNIEKELRAVSKKLAALNQTVEKLADALGKKEKTEAPKAKASKATAPKAKAPKAMAPKAKAPKAKKSSTEKGKELSAADTVLGFIRRSKKGIDTGALMGKTGFNQKKIANIIYKLKKQGAIKSPEKGAYVKA